MTRAKGFQHELGSKTDGTADSIFDADADSEADKRDAANPPRRKTYGFQDHVTHGGEKDDKQISRDLKALKYNLNLDKVPADAEAALREFVTLHHANIDWYQKGIAREQKRKRRYMVVTVALLVGIPAGMALSSRFLAGSTGLLEVQVTAVLTSLIAIHRFISTVLERRETGAAYHKASSRLKTNVFTLERTLVRPKDQDDADYVDSLISTLESMNADARRVVTEEEEASFGLQMRHHTIDVASTLSGAASDVTSLRSDLRSFVQDRHDAIAELMAEKQQERVRLRAEKQQLESMINSRKCSLKEAMDDDKRRHLVKVISDFEEARDDKTVELAAVEAEIELARKRAAAG